MAEPVHLPIPRRFLDESAQFARHLSSAVARERAVVSGAVRLALAAQLEASGLPVAEGRSSEIKYADLLDVCDLMAGDWRIEVRTTSGADDAGLYVPAMPLIVGVLSDFYVAARVDASLTAAGVLGFAIREDLASAELTINGMFAVLPADELRAFPDLGPALREARPADPERDRVYRDWSDRAERLMNALGNLLEGEGVFGTNEMAYLAGRLRDDILRSYGKRLPKTGIEPLFEQLFRRFGIETPVPASPDAPVQFESPVQDDSKPAQGARERDFALGNLNVRERASLYRDLLEDTDALKRHQETQRVLDAATGGQHNTSPRRRARTRQVREEASERSPADHNPDVTKSGDRKIELPRPSPANDRSRPEVGPIEGKVEQRERIMSLNFDGPMYTEFTKNSGLYSDDDRGCIQRTVERLFSNPTSADRPGMLLGKIQSGKTKTFLAVIALAFDNGFDISIVLTKGTKALTKQTLERIKREFGTFEATDSLQIYDIMTLPSNLRGYELDQKLIFVAKKQSDNMDRLIAVFDKLYPQLANRRVLIVDDEADYASIGFKNSKQDGVTANVTAQQIDGLRSVLRNSAFLQVTATPYSLYLQPEDIEIQGVEFKPIKPAFTELVPVHADYIGSDYYFDRSLEHETVASYIYHPITAQELLVLHNEDRRRFKTEDCLTSNAIVSLRDAICNFLVGGCIRRLQDEHLGKIPKKFSFIVHTEAGTAAHAWQETIANSLNEGLRAAVSTQPDLLRDLITGAYRDLSASVRVLEVYLPPLEDVVGEAFKALGQDWMMITKVNSERQVEELLDSQGQLRLRTPLNIFIGGQILDRGVTIANLIGFFYGRKPQIYQQDTVLQHSRMFGFRPIEDLAVTRFYTEPTIYDAMRRMHESDVALREGFVTNPGSAVVFIQRDPRGSIIPCSPNKVLISNTTTLSPFKRILPVGFQSDFKTKVRPIVQEVDQILDKALRGEDMQDPFEISLQVALDLLRKIEPTLVMDTNLGHYFDWDSCRSALEYMSMSATNPANRGKVLCLVRHNRNASRFQPMLGAPFFSDSPDTAQREGAIARQFATDIPMLTMLRENGTENEGWRGTPFYWPVIYAQGKIRTAIFAHKTTV
jgi:hypothetical protein